MAGQFAVGHRIGALLEFEHLEVHTLALVGHNEVGVHRALGSASLVPVGGGVGIRRDLCSSKMLLGGNKIITQYKYLQIMFHACSSPFTVSLCLSGYTGQFVYSCTHNVHTCTTCLVRWRIFVHM